MEEDRKTTEAQRKAVYKYDEKFERSTAVLQLEQKKGFEKPDIKASMILLNLP